MGAAGAPLARGASLSARDDRRTENEYYIFDFNVFLHCGLPACAESMLSRYVPLRWENNAVEQNTERWVCPRTSPGKVKSMVVTKDINLPARNEDQ